MKVIVAEKCGFCPGVRNAISIAEKILAREKNVYPAPRPALRKGGVYSLGPIIHNKDVVEKLAKMGLKTVESQDQIPSLRRKGYGGQAPTVIIRSHGLAPKQKEKLKKKGLNIVDATCVLVKRVQKLAKNLERQGYKVVVIGDKNHPEIQAVVGSARSVVVLADESDLSRLFETRPSEGLVEGRDLHNLPLNNKLGVVCQTTQSPEHFAKMLDAIAKTGFTTPLRQGRGLPPPPVSELKVINTLCTEAIKRQQAAVKLCKKVDIMFVLGSLESANTRKLAELCKKYNKQTFHLQNWSEFDKKLLPRPCRRGGVTAGASTPEWIIKEFVENLKKLNVNARPAKQKAGKPAATHRGE